MNHIFVICTVRGVSAEQKAKQEAYVASLEAQGYSVHYPPRDTDQTATGYEICKQNGMAMHKAKEVHIFYNPSSQGTHFDMGVLFGFLLMDEVKPIVIVENGEVLPGKCYPRMLLEWQEYVDGLV